jgi:hypothetical protein
MKIIPKIYSIDGRYETRVDGKGELRGKMTV